MDAKNAKPLLTATKVGTKRKMEALIDHFKFYTTNSKTYNHPTHNYISVEAPKGESGRFVVNLKGNQYRVKLRSPGFYNLQSIHYRSKKLLLADLVTIIGTQDIVFGEIDR